MTRIICCLLFLIGTFSPACETHGQGTQNEANPNPGRRTLAQNFRAHGKALLVYPSRDSELKAAYLKIANNIQQQSNQNLKIDVKPCSDVTVNDLKETVPILLGTCLSNQIIEQIQPKLPFSIEQDKLNFDQRLYEDTSLIMTLPFYPNPMNKQLPMLMVTGLDDKPVLDYLQDSYGNKQRIFGWSSWGYELYRQGQRIIFGFFNDEDWSLDKKVHFDYSQNNDTISQGKYFDFIYQPKINHPQAQQFQARCEANMERIIAFTAAKKTLPKIKYHLYRSAEQKGLMISNTNHSSINYRNNEVHTVLNDIYADNETGEENRLILRQLLGEPKSMVLEAGLAVYFTKNWQRKGYAYWAKRLYDSGNAFSLPQLMRAQDFINDSRYIKGALAGSFVAFLLEKYGKQYFLDNYKEWTFDANALQVLEGEWYAYLERQATANANAKSDELPYLKGFNFAHEGYRIYNGYISKEATRALEKMSDLGVNTAAIVPYSYMQDPQKANFIGVANNPGGENDESIVHAARQAQKMGMTTVLKPQIWIGWDSWPGDVEMQSEEAWKQWFDYYYRWILHYAMMAEIHELDVLVIGTEFVKATLQREADWRALIAKIRGIYSGKLTYAANWGDEFEKMTFWDAFDYIGINSYYPLSKDKNATDKTLKKGFQAVIDRIEKVYQKEKKPIIFTEIGFRSIEAPWTEPHAEPNKNFNASHQERCYDIVLEAIEGKQWCHGILWWKFPSYLDYRGTENTSFSPNNKPAEAVISKWFN